MSPLAGIPAPEGRPVFATIGETNSDDARSDAPGGVVHVVSNGDTLQRLAKRYLQDEGRALEIFDLNREALTNPHLLPIGAELIIPQDKPLD